MRFFARSFGLVASRCAALLPAFPITTTSKPERQRKRTRREKEKAERYPISGRRAARPPRCTGRPVSGNRSAFSFSSLCVCAGARFGCGGDWKAGNKAAQREQHTARKNRIGLFRKRVNRYLRKLLCIRRTLNWLYPSNNAWYSKFPTIFAPAAWDDEIAADQPGLSLVPLPHRPGAAHRQIRVEEAAPVPSLPLLDCHQPRDVGMVPISPPASLVPRSIGLINRIELSGSAARTRRTISSNSFA